LARAVLIQWEPYPTDIFLGKLANLSSSDNYSELLKRIELLLIYYCQPVINIQGKRAHHVIKSGGDTVVINYNKRYRLPYVLSNLVEKEDFYLVVGNTLERSIAQSKGEGTC
jgi:hypothetical protein